MKYIKPDGTVYNSLSEAASDTTGVMILTDSLYHEYRQTNLFQTALSEHFGHYTTLPPSITIHIDLDGTIAIHTTKPVKLHLRTPATNLSDPHVITIGNNHYYRDDILVNHRLQIKRSL
jgi:hypothetical protein